ncbi:ALP1-like protein [Tanacetum coccineum]
MMSDSSSGGLSDLDDIDDLEMIMQQVQAEQEQEEEVERVRHRNYIYRERLDAEERLMADYFGPNPKYPEYYFRKRYRMSRKLFLEIVSDFFTMCVIELFMPEYLRKPDLDDIQNLYTAHNNIHGFPEMLGSIDCMHWEWRNCPKAWHGQFARDDKKYPTIMLEAVASYDLWIWHAFFGVAGANNDLTVLNNSPLFDDLLDDIAPVLRLNVTGLHSKKGIF